MFHTVGDRLQGVTVVLVARRLELLDQAANRIKETGGKALVKDDALLGVVLLSPVLAKSPRERRN